MPEYVDLDLDELVRQFIDRVGLDPGEGTATATPLSDEISQSFDQLAALPQNTPEGGLSVRIGKRHIKLRKALWETAITGALAAIAPFDPTHITTAAAAVKIVEYLRTFKEFVAKLDPAEIYVYDAVVAATAMVHNSARTLRSEYPSRADIEELIKSRGEEVPANLHDILDELVRIGGLAVVFEQDGQTRYKRVV